MGAWKAFKKVDDLKKAVAQHTKACGQARGLRYS